MPDAWRAYLEMALGLTEVSRKKAQKTAADLLGRGGETAAQLQGIAEDLLSAGMANREALTNIVRYEVDRALGVVGLATADEVTELNTRVRDLERQLRDAQARASAAEHGTLPRKAAKKATPNAMPTAASVPPVNAPTVPAQGGTAAKKTVAKKAIAKKAAPTTGPAPVKKAVAKKAVAKKSAEAAPPPGTAEAPTAPVKAAAAATELPPVKRAASKKQIPAKKTVAKKAPAKKARPTTDTAPEA